MKNDNDYAIMKQDHTFSLPEITGVKLRIKDVSGDHRVSSADSQSSIDSIDMASYRRNSLQSLLVLKLQHLNEQYQTIRRLIRQYKRQYKYIKKTNLQLNKLLDNQKLSNVLVVKLTVLYAKVVDDLKDFCRDSYEDTGDLKLPLHCTNEVKKISGGLTNMQPVINKLTMADERQRGQTLRILESTLFHLGGKFIHSTGEEYLLTNIKNPVIATYIVKKGNGTTGNDLMIDVIRDIIRFYQLWLTQN